MQDRQYAGFWIRTLAAVIDTVFLLVLIGPLLYLFFADALTGNGAAPGGALWIVVNYLLPAAIVLMFWFFKSATPGKLMLGLRIIDAQSGASPSAGQFLLRYVGYYVSMLPLFLGIIWVGFDAEKRAWHDMLARTRVIHTR